MREVAENSAMTPVGTEHPPVSSSRLGPIVRLEHDQSALSTAMSTMSNLFRVFLVVLTSHVAPPPSLIVPEFSLVCRNLLDRHSLKHLLVFSNWCS